MADIGKFLKKYPPTVTHFIKDFITGAIDQQVLNECTKGTVDLASNLVSSIKKFKQGGPLGYSEAILSLAQVAYSFTPTVSKCFESYH